MSNNLARLDRYKLDSIFTDTNVTHRMIKSDILTGSRRIEVLTTWVQERELGAGSFGEVSLQRELVSGELRAVKSIDKRRWRVHEMDALIDLQDVRMMLGERELSSVLTPIASLSLRPLSGLVRVTACCAYRDGVYPLWRSRPVYDRQSGHGQVGSEGDCVADSRRSRGSSQTRDLPSRFEATGQPTASSPL